MHAVRPARRRPALRGCRSRLELGAPRGVRRARPQPDRDLQREGRAAAGPRVADQRAAQRGRRGAGADGDEPLPRHRPRHGAPTRSRCWRTAAVRDASNGPALRRGTPPAACPACRSISCPASRRPNCPLRGVLCGIPSADGVLADIGGGSLEVVRLTDGERGEAHTLPLGVIRLAERAGGDPVRARALAEADLAEVPLAERRHGARPLSGGRRLAGAGAHPYRADRLPAEHDPPLHDRTRRGARPDRRDRGAPRGARWNACRAMPRRRIDDLPFAAVVLRRVLRATGARRVVFSANGLREGWYMQRDSAGGTAREDPLLAAGHDLAAPIRPRSDAAAGAAGLDRPAVPRRAAAKHGGCARRRAG